MTALPDYLKQHVALIHGQDVANHVVRFNLQLWEKYFADSVGWSEFHGRCTQSTITRGDLCDWEVDLDQSGSIRAYFLAVMAWGYGRVGYGPYRTQRALATLDFDVQFRYVYSWICRHDVFPLEGLEQAYDIKVSYFGSAFFTKLFYFIGRNRQTPYPIILDSVVANRLERQLGLEIGRYAKVTRTKSGSIGSVNRYPAGYINFVADMHAWAQELDCEADQIEMFLFGAQP